MEAASQTTDLKRFDASQGPRIVGPDGGKAVDLGIDRRPDDGLDRGDGRGLLARRASDAAAAPGGPAPQALARGRVQLRDRGADGRPARRRRRLRGGGGPGVQAARPVAHVLERRRRAVPDPGDHLAGRLRAFLRRARSDRWRRRSSTPRSSGSWEPATGSSSSPTACRELCEEHGLDHPMLHMGEPEG